MTNHTLTITDFAAAAGFELTSYQKDILRAMDDQDTRELITLAPVQYGKSYVRDVFKSLKRAGQPPQPMPKGLSPALVIMDECYCPCGRCTSTMEDCAGCCNSPAEVAEIRGRLGLPQMPGKGCGGYRPRMQYEGLLGVMG